MSLHNDISLRITRPCSCGARLDIESTPPGKALREEERFLELHGGAGHGPVREDNR